MAYSLMSDMAVTASPLVVASRNGRDTANWSTGRFQALLELYPIRKYAIVEVFPDQNLQV
ncbi:hypothetical protein HJFPF1_11898 [Paramyrothecium foliicola]|nr:hypothetical protein HJFPF1_11898 [Paramyrothecium foliicola]